MSALSDQSAATEVASGTIDTLRRAGRVLLWSAGVFLLGLVSIIVSGSVTGSAAAEEAAATQRGVDVNDLPVDVLAEIHRGDPWVGNVLVAIPLVAAALLLALGVSTVGRVAREGRRALTVAATVLAVAAAVAWTFVQVAGPFYSTSLHPLVLPAVMAFTALGSAAVAAAAVVARERGAARRAGSVVVVLGVLIAIGGFVVTPPFAPFILAVVIGIPLARLRPPTTM
jgi:MFS family permease